MKRKKSKATTGDKKPCLTIRAYCSKCNKLLMESPVMSKRQLLASWDNAVLNAPGIVCPDCKTKIPNFELYLKIYHQIYKQEFDPSDVLPVPKNAPDIDSLSQTATIQDMMDAAHNS